MPLIVSLSIRVLGLESLAHFRFAPAVSLAAHCDGCGSRSRSTLCPVVLFDDSADRSESDGKPLCKTCSTMADRRWNAEWPVLTTGGALSAWALVATEQDAETAEQAGRERSVATTLDELHQATARALEQARVNQSIDRFGKVA